MNKKWSEKTTLEKVTYVISCVALCIWLVFEYLERTGKFAYASMVTYIAVLVACLCFVVLYWIQTFSYANPQTPFDMLYFNNFNQESTCQYDLF